ncbi:hypothetical protein EDB89DRAFT_2167200 [Lactarius sanguifluus]|nr:hypothetical protein EDB89DRAFT_2167200 [Lactarius sanguifluus]
MRVRPRSTSIPAKIGRSAESRNNHEEQSGLADLIRVSHKADDQRTRTDKMRTTAPRHTVKRNNTCPGDENLKYEHTQRGGVEGDAARQERTEIGSIQPQIQAWPPSCKWTLVLFHGATTQRLLGCTPAQPDSATQAVRGLMYKTFRKEETTTVALTSLITGNRSTNALSTGSTELGPGVRLTNGSIADGGDPTKSESYYQGKFTERLRTVKETIPSLRNKYDKSLITR